MKKALATGDSITPYYLDRLRERGLEAHNLQEHLSEEALLEALQRTQAYLLVAWSMQPAMCYGARQTSSCTPFWVRANTRSSTTRRPPSWASPSPTPWAP